MKRLLLFFALFYLSAPLLACDVKYEGYSKFINIEDSEYKIILTTPHGCGGKLQRPVEFKNMTFSIYKKENLVSKIDFRNSYWSPSSRKLILSTPMKVWHDSLFKSKIRIVHLDLEKGNLKTPSGHFIKLF